MPHAAKIHHPTPLGPLDGEMDIDPPLQLIHLPPYPRELIPEVNLIAEFLPAELARAQRVQRRGDDGRGRFLVVEDEEGGRGEDGDEDRETPSPHGPEAGEGWELAIGAVF